MKSIKLLLAVFVFLSVISTACKKEGPTKDIITYEATIVDQEALFDNSFFSSVDGLIYIGATFDPEGDSDAKINAKKIDIGCYHINSPWGLYLAAPGEAGTMSEFSYISTWSVKNMTKFGTTALTETEFDAIVDDTEIIEAASGLTATRVKILKGDVIAFITASTSANPAKKGLIKVIDIYGVQDQIYTIADLEVKIQD